MTVLWFILDLVFHSTFFVSSAHLSVWMQQHYDGSFYYFAWFWWNTTNYMWQFWPFIALFVYPNRALGLKSYSGLLFANWAKNFFKLLYLDDRPNLEFGDILPYACKCEYGKPSGTLYNTTTIFMAIAWDLWGRRISAPAWSRIFALALGLIGSLCTIWSIVWIGTHAYNQMLLSMFLALTQFWVMVVYEDQIINFWEVIINRSYDKFKKYLAVSMSVCAIMIVMYIIPLTINWNALDYSRFLTHGSCPQCAGGNFSKETLISITSSLHFVILVLIFSATKHVYVYDRWWILSHFNFKGVARIVIAVICWMPMFLMFFPPMSGPVQIAISSVCKQLISTTLLFVFAPYLYRCFKLEVPGDIATRAIRSNHENYDAAYVNLSSTGYATHSNELA